MRQDSFLYHQHCCESQPNTQILRQSGCSTLDSAPFAVTELAGVEWTIQCNDCPDVKLQKWCPTAGPFIMRISTCVQHASSSRTTLLLHFAHYARNSVTCQKEPHTHCIKQETASCGTFTTMSTKCQRRKYSRLSSPSNSYGTDFTWGKHTRNESNIFVLTGFSCYLKNSLCELVGFLAHQWQQNTDYPLVSSMRLAGKLILCSSGCAPGSALNFRAQSPCAVLQNHRESCL